ncbi:hypothetical protein [Kitasatospora sp. MAP5-34]|uniref:hypothetical protein n=1 Tax=Kitasatospora sp. MAP5-34 TaxID=3035102 RepID=UPI00247378C4|nr:hypothetical protein [Kitasatospora sp. MAP5-34]MDH6577568.1 hypothetical protein [Kitasatospora sp. MAP5-34]
MTNQSTIGPADLVPVLQRAELLSVHALELHATRSSGDHPTKITWSMESGMAPSDESVDYKYDAKCVLTDDDESPIAELYVAVLAHYSLADGPPISDAVLNAFGNVITTPAVFPYLRQYLQDMAARIGLPGFTLGLLKPNPEHQVTVSLNSPALA